MSPKDAVASYYEAWISKRGDMSSVPLAADFKFRGPVASFDDADSYSIIDWEMALPVAPMTSAEILEVENGQIVRSELIYDAQELRTAMTAASSLAPAPAEGAV